MRSAVLAVALLAASGCSLYFEPDHQAPAPDAGVDPDHHCASYTATIFSPQDQATYPTRLDARFRWNQGVIPDRYLSLSDDFGNYFQPVGSEEVQGDGSIIEHLQLPAGGSFNLEIGWICDAGNGGPSVPLARARFYTAP